MIAHKIRGRLAVAALTAGLFALPMTASALVIQNGLDYFSTVPTSHYNFGAPIGDIFLGYNPIGPFATTNFGMVQAPGVTLGADNADTVVERLEDTVDLNVGDSDTIAIEVVALSLKSVTPVDIAGTFYDVFVDLNGTSPGTMTIDYLWAEDGTDAAEGSFDSTMNLDLLVRVIEVGTSNVMVLGSLSSTVSSSGSCWSTTKGSRPMFIDEGPNFFAVGCPGTVDDIETEHEHANFAGTHIVIPANPEIDTTAAPGALALLLGGLALVRERSRRRRAV